MISVGLSQNINKIPKSVFDWLKEREEKFPDVEYQVYYSDYKSEAEKNFGMKYERMYMPIPHLRYVNFPRPDGFWSIKLIGDQMRAIEASGFEELLKSGSLEPISETVSRGYVGMGGNISEEMVDIDGLLG